MADLLHRQPRARTATRLADGDQPLLLRPIDLDDPLCPRAVWRAAHPRVDVAGLGSCTPPGCAQSPRLRPVEWCDHPGPAVEPDLQPLWDSAVALRLARNAVVGQFVEGVGRRRERRQKANCKRQKAKGSRRGRWTRDPSHRVTQSSSHPVPSPQSPIPNPLAVRRPLRRSLLLHLFAGAAAAVDPAADGGGGAVARSRTCPRQPAWHWPGRVDSADRRCAVGDLLHRKSRLLHHPHWTGQRRRARGRGHSHQCRTCAGHVRVDRRPQPALQHSFPPSAGSAVGPLLRAGDCPDALALLAAGAPVVVGGAGCDVAAYPAQ